MRTIRQLTGFLPRALTLIVGCVSVAAAPVTPAPVPDPGIPGFRFPESEATLTRWITEMTRGDPATAAAAFEKIHLHGWGLWTALTEETAHQSSGQSLRVFETWQTTEELAHDLVRTVPDPSPLAAAAPPVARPRLRSLAPLRIRDAERETETAPRAAPAERALGFVKFDPSAAAHIAQQQLFRRDSLDALLDAGATQIPPFPATALTIKSLFQVIRRRDLAQGRYHALKAWPGPPAKPRPWAPAHWPGAAWIDVQNGGNGRGAIDPIALADGSTRTDATTYPLARIVHFRVSAAEAATLNAQSPEAPPAVEGDLALLVAMHVTGREIARWTWQTFWWTPSPENPGAPSSAAIASLRPVQLQGAARNYAMALAYTMLSPDQPYVGGSNEGAAVYAYNPWLEAKLAPADLPGSVPGFAPDGKPAANNHGVQTNCMSCHAQANYNPRQRATAPRLAGARYVDLGSADFVGTLQVDFLWSIARHAR